MLKGMQLNDCIILSKPLYVVGVALAGILAVLHSCLDLKATIGGSQYHHILYFLTPAMKPRMLMTVDKDMNLLPVSVRVGQAVDVVAQVRCSRALLHCFLPAPMRRTQLAQHHAPGVGLHSALCI